MQQRWTVRVARVPIVVMTIAAVFVAPRAAEARPAAAADDERYQEEGDTRMEQGDAHQAAGAHADAALAYAKAFEAYARRSTVDAKEKQAVSLAVDELKLAQEADPQSLALLEQEAALLERFIAHPKRRGAVPEGMAEELARVKKAIEERRRQAEAQAEVGQSEESERSEEPEPDRRARREAVAILSSGVVGIVGGAALVGAGMWTYAAGDQRRDAQLAALEDNDYLGEDGIRDRLGAWHQRGRAIATGLTVGGAVLAGAGIGLVAWGAVKLRRAGEGSKARASVVLPMVSRDGVGVVARVAF